MRLSLCIGGHALWLEELPSDVEKRARVRYAMEWALRRSGSRRVALVIADQGCAGEIEMEVPLGLVKQPGFRLAAFAAVFPPVRTIIDCVDPTAGQRGILRHAAMHLLEVGHAHDAAADARLVGCDERAVARFT